MKKILFLISALLLSVNTAKAQEASQDEKIQACINNPNNQQGNQAIFNNIDTNSDTYITWDEWKTYEQSKQENYDENMSHKFFDNMDIVNGADDDEKVSFENFFIMQCIVFVSTMK